MDGCVDETKRNDDDDDDDDGRRTRATHRRDLDRIAETDD